MTGFQAQCATNPGCGQPAPRTQCRAQIIVQSRPDTSPLYAHSRSIFRVPTSRNHLQETNQYGEEQRTQRLRDTQHRQRTPNIAPRTARRNPSCTQEETDERSTASGKHRTCQLDEAESDERRASTSFGPAPQESDMDWRSVSEAVRDECTDEVSMGGYVGAWHLFASIWSSTTQPVQALEYTYSTFFVQIKVRNADMCQRCSS